MSLGWAGQRPVEVELKYRVLDEAAGERYLGADSIGSFTAASRVRSSQIEDRYVDTADGALARAGFAIRLRNSASGTIVSVKSTTRREGSGNAHRREELEGPADRTAGPLDWPTSDARSLILELAGDAALVELVTVRQLRRKRELRDGGTRVELSFDQVDVVARSQIVESFIELEVELVKGDDGRLEDLDRILAADPSLSPSTQSKLELAMAALRTHGSSGAAVQEIEAVVDDAVPSGDAEPEVSEAEPEAEVSAAEPAPEAEVSAAEPAPEAEVSAAELEPEAEVSAAEPEPEAEVSAAEPEPEAELEVSAAETPAPEPAHLVVGKTPGVTSDDHVAEAGRKVLRFHLARMLAREAGTRAGVDAEELHGMRVATRRQRAAWRVFGSAFRPGRTRRYRRGLREIAARLGAVRDLDVLLEAIEAYRADLPSAERRGLEPLVASWREHREDARVLLIRELDSDGYRRWVDDYRDFVRTEGAAVLPVGPVQPHRIRDTTPSRIWVAYEQVRAYEPVLRWADVETLHDLRIAAKWLRYTLEFVREALGPESAPLISRVTAMQDHLGLMNDASVAGSLARTFLVEHAGELTTAQSAAIGRYLVNREREVARLHRTIGTSWRGVAGIGFRRGLGRVVAGL